MKNVRRRNVIDIYPHGGDARNIACHYLMKWIILSCTIQ
jgi:hypothetical protein